jgi:hypothetical protein
MFTNNIDANKEVLHRNQQELLDVIIASYRLSPKKMKRPFTLHIVCKKCEGFSLNDIMGVN